MTKMMIDALIKGESLTHHAHTRATSADSILLCLF
jgi:hypothetical protein